MKAQCLFFTGINSVDVGTTELPEPSPEDVVVETRYSCISPGTELRCLSGNQEGLGMNSFPFIPGYSLVGTVVQPDAAGLHERGSLVFCSGARKTSHLSAWGGHISHAVVPATSAFPLPAGIDLVEASVLKLAAIAYRGFRLARFTKGERVVVLGLGPIGQLSAQIFRAAGADVIAADLSPDRVALASQAGLKSVCIAAGNLSTITTVWPQGAHIVVDATGYGPALIDAVKLVIDKPWDDSDPAPGRLVIQGSYSSNIAFPQGMAFAKELMVLWPRDNQWNDMKEVSALFSQNALKGRALVGGVFPIREAQQVYADMRASKGALLTAVFQW